MKLTRPAVRWHGGKWMLAPWIIEHFPPHRIYVEPFGGGGSVLLRKEPSYAEVYNDLDCQLVNLFRVLRDPARADALRRQLELTPFAREEFALSYLPSKDPVEQARRTVARVFMAFGTTSSRKNMTGFRAKAYRQNQTGARDWANYPAAIPAFVERLRGVTIECRDAVEVIRQQDTPDTLFYCDPPYMLGTRTSMAGRNSSHERAYKHELTDAGHAQLLATLHDVTGMVVVSGYASPLYDAALSDWQRIERAALADGAKPRLEVLWLNAAAASRIETTIGQAA